MKSSDYIFFLGGYDAEMFEIKEILTKYDLAYIDKKLSWGAKASDYKNEISNLKKDEIPVLIELVIDIPLPENTVIIDHHNEKAGKDAKTSIEQIADLLKIELNRWQQLISANDKDYIDGMIELNATAVEIKEIRKLDRKCQGVTKEDEVKAQESIKNNLIQLNYKTVLINSLTERTSPIFDELHGKYKNIFIITPNKEINFSGEGDIISLLIDFYKSEKQKKIDINYWYGGELPEKGFFGSQQNLFDTAYSIKRDIMDNLIYSQHIFLFPFKINVDTLDNKTFEKKNSSSKVHSSYEKLEKIKKVIEKNNGWKYKTFEMRDTRKINNDNKLTDEEIKRIKSENIWAYNETRYFHNYANDALFTTKEDVINKKPISYYFEWELEPSDHFLFEVEINDYNEKVIFKKNYKLSIDHLSLRIFETGIGILTFTLYNLEKKQSGFEDILKINDFGRRIYPQMLGDPTGTNATKNLFLCNKATLNLGSKPVEENFNTDDYLYTEFKERKLAKYLTKLLDPLKVEPIIDDRMYVLCWYGNKELMDKLKSRNNKEMDYTYEHNEDWYKYIFVDGNDIGIANNKMMRELISQSTYARFVESGTLYGITRYSFMCLTDDSWFAKNILRNHMQKMYYQMVILLLTQRASALKFSDEVAEVAGLADKIYSTEKDNGNNYDTFKKIMLKVETLNKDIILFINRIWFLEVTPQEQGIELYKLAQKNLGINEEIKELRTEIKELYDFVQLKVEQGSSNSLAMLGLVFIPLTLITGIFGMNLFFFKEIFEGNSKGGLGILIISISVLVFSVWLLMRFTKRLFTNFSDQKVTIPIGRLLFKSFRWTTDLLLIIIIVLLFVLSFFI